MQEAQAQKRELPNVLVTGTPGVGKSTLCKRLSVATGLKWIEISKVANENDCLEEYDAEYQCPVLEEDKLLGGLEECMWAGGNIVDYHSSEFFPERWFDVVFVLRTDNTTLFDRLTNRGYTGRKLQDNVDSEIFQISLEEARNSYKDHIVYELVNTTSEQLEENINIVSLWLKEWFQRTE